MMGHSHAISGVLGWLIIAPVLASKDIMPVDVATVAAGAIICSGAALLPDMDHPSSTIARFLGPVSHVVSQGINVIAGGHRKATHSLLFVLLSFFGTWAAVHFLGNPAAWVIMFFMAGLAARGLHLAPKEGAKGYITVIVIALATTVVAAKWGPQDWSWLPWAMGVGAFIHLIGDSLTPGGVPLFWPAKSRLALPVLPSTGGFIELKILTPLMIIGIVYFAWTGYLSEHIKIPWIS